MVIAAIRLFLARSETPNRVSMLLAIFITASSIRGFRQCHVAALFEDATVQGEPTSNDHFVRQSSQPLTGSPL
jgi:hypothetical protein